MNADTYQHDYGTSMGPDTMIVYLIRHGQSYNTHPTEDDPYPTNPPLTPAGREQAKLVAKRMRGLRVDRLICSPMIRTIETALAIAPEVGLPIEIWPRCHEYRAVTGYLCAGARELRPRYPELVLPPDFGEDEWQYGNESLESGMPRAADFLRWVDMEAAPAGVRRLAVVTHGTFSRLVLCQVFGADLEPLRRLWFDNSEVSTLELSARGFRVIGLNDTSHLIGADGLDPVLGVTR